MRGADGRRRGVLDRIRAEERLALVYVAGVGLLLAAHGIPFSLGPLLVQYAKFVGALTGNRQRYLERVVRRFHFDRLAKHRAIDHAILACCFDQI